MVPFAGWDMPSNYGSQITEHEVVRSDAGMFDVSHMTVVDVSGAEAKAYLQHLLANDVARLGVEGKALYSCMLNEQGGVIDDLIAYYLRDNFYRVIINSATREKDLAWLAAQAEAFTDITPYKLVHSPMGNYAVFLCILGDRRLRIHWFYEFEVPRIRLETGWRQYGQERIMGQPWSQPLFERQDRLGG